MSTVSWPPTTIWRLAALLGLGVTCSLLAGCGRAAASIAGAGHAAPTRTAMLIATSTATAPETSMPGPNCQTRQLALVQDHNGVALGHVSVLLRIGNRSQQTCALEGYPTMQLLDARQQPLPTHQQKTTMAYMFTVPAPLPVVLAPGASAYVHLEWSDVAPSDQACSSGAAFLRITPPQNQTPLLAQLPICACDGAIITSPLAPSAASS